MSRSPRTILLLVLGAALVATITAVVVRESAPTPLPPPREAAPAGPPPTVAMETLEIGASRSQTIRARVGQPLRLTVAGASRSDVVAIPDLGQTAQISEDLDAVFDLLPDRADTYEIKLLESDETVGALRITD